MLIGREGRAAEPSVDTLPLGGRVVGVGVGVVVVVVVVAFRS